jgi:hypothetical protein
VSRSPRTLADVVPLAATEPDGLMVTTDGTYVRLLECADVLQPQAGGPAHREQIRRRLAALAARIPAGQGAQVIVEAEPLDADTALESDRRQTDAAVAAAHRRGEAELAGALRRLGYGLEQTIRRSAPLVDAARLRWTLATRHTPRATSGSAIAAAGELTRPLTRPAVRTLNRANHERAAADSAVLSDTLAAELAAAGVHVQPLDGADALAALARGVHPNAEPDARELADVPRVLVTTDAGRALEHRHDLLTAIGGDSRLRMGRDWLTHDVTGELEAVLHLSAPPQETSVWWLLGLMQLPAPWRLAVHLRATDRARQRRRHRLRYKRLWADMRRRERDGKLIPHEAYEEEREAAELDAELRLTGAAGLYDVSLYLAIRRPAGAEDELGEVVRALPREFESYTDARLYGGRFLVEDSWVSTLPLATDRLGATRRFAHRNIGDCLPLLTTSASSRGGAPLGYAIPGQTLERVDLFDERYRTHVALVTGASGSGKTVAVNALLARNIARGATGYIIDRSSSEDEGGLRRHHGHYEPLVSLIPGARVIHFGADHHLAVLNPWDVTDAANVPASKVEFLVALHTLLIGDTTTGEHAVLGGLERTLLARGIQSVYARCARTGEAPCEHLLRDELRRLAREQAGDTEDGDASVASELRRLAERLHPYVGDGPAAWLADRPTTLPSGAPLLLFDLAGLPDALAGPVMLTLVDHIDRDVARRRAHHLTHPNESAGPWAGRSFVAIDEAWKPLMTPAAGAWLNEWARRTRHIACALLVITQHLADFANPQGAALLRNSVLRLFFKAAHEELAYVHDALGLHPEDLQTIERLETRKGQYSTCFLDSEAHGRAQVRLYLSDIEYWTCSADPHRDQPIRQLALHEAEGDAWAAMRLLVDPAWHRERAAQLTTPDDDDVDELDAEPDAA